MSTGLPPAGSDARYEQWRWRIFCVTWMAYAGYYLTRKSFSVAKIEMAQPTVLGWNLADMAWVDGAFLVAYAVGQFFFGALGDRFGTRKVILVGMLASVLTAFVTGALSSVLGIGLLFALQGVCQSTGWGPLTKNVGEFFSRGERGRVLGLWCSNLALGGMLASIIAGVAAQALGWRYAFWAPAGCLLLIWIVFFLFQQNRPEDLELPPIEQYHGERETVFPLRATADEEAGPRGVMWGVLTNRMVWLLAAVYFLLKPTRYLVMFWSPFYINAKLGTGAAESGFLSSFFELAGLPGMFLGGYVSDRVFRSRRMPVAVLTLLAAALLILCFAYLPATGLALGAGFFAIGFLIHIPDSLVSGTAAIDFGTRRGASTAVGLINCCGSAGAVLGATLPGWIGRFIGEGGDTWDWSFGALAGALLLAAGLLTPQWNRLPCTVRAMRRDGETEYEDQNTRAQLVLTERRAP